MPYIFREFAAMRYLRSEVSLYDPLAGGYDKFQ
jgi:hypothetical protein